MVAMSVSRNHLQLRTTILLTIDQLFNGPAKAARTIRVDGLKDEQDGTELEKDDRADKGRYTAAIGDLAVKLGRGGCHGEPHEEGLFNCIVRSITRAQSLVSQ